MGAWIADFVMKGAISLDTSSKFGRHSQVALVQRYINSSHSPSSPVPTFFVLHHFLWSRGAVTLTPLEGKAVEKELAWVIQVSSTEFYW